jgi:uncharacterized protein YlxP (DUF503 family)
MDLQDTWQDAVISCGMVGNENAHLQQSLQAVADWTAQNWLDISVVDNYIELI